MLTLAADGSVATACARAAELLGTTVAPPLGGSLEALLVAQGWVVPQQMKVALQDPDRSGSWRICARGSERPRRRLTAIALATGGRAIVVEDLSAYAEIRSLWSHCVGQLERLQALTLSEVALGPLVHDLSNLLSAAFAEASLQSSRRSGHHALAALDRIERITRSAATMLRQLLQARDRGCLLPESGTAELDTVLQDLAPVLRDCLEATGDLELDLAAGPCPVPLSPLAIERIALNLVLNARDAMCPGRGTARIHTERRGEGEVIWSVCDTGEGMPEQVLARALDPLFTTKSDGCGIGLALVHRMVRQAGGRVELQSERGLGTTVRIVLPGG